MKNIVILGASGSIGLQTMDVILRHPDKFRCVGLSVKSRIDMISDVLTKNVGWVVCVEKSDDAQKYSIEFPQHRFVWGEDGLIEIACLKEADTVVNALVGFVGCKPTLAAIEAKKNIALANKETLVAAGKIVIDAVKRNGVSLMPIDSEHSAIAQCLSTYHGNIKRLILTASGGSFRDKSRSELNHVTLSDALNHPNWTMGAKITIDSATMMNKGLEVIEAHWLFDVSFDQIDVIMHRQSIVHSMVEFEDRAIIAQLGTPDMRIPIQYALSYPQRLKLELPSLDLVKAHSLTFDSVDFERFPLLKCAYLAGKREDNSAAALNGANEEAVAAFLAGNIRFIDIDSYVVKAFESMTYGQLNSLDDAVAADQMGREWIRKKISGGNV
jgi:1-deoxy-D-xylulose-5-phosphate reductoisomerase